jgi:hypothetical protein
LAVDCGASASQEAARVLAIMAIAGVRARLGGLRLRARPSLKSAMWEKRRAAAWQISRLLEVL